MLLQPWENNKKLHSSIIVVSSIICTRLRKNIFEHANITDAIVSTERKCIYVFSIIQCLHIILLIIVN